MTDKPVDERIGECGECGSPTVAGECIVAACDGTDEE